MVLVKPSFIVKYFGYMGAILSMILSYLSLGIYYYFLNSFIKLSFLPHIDFNPFYNISNTDKDARLKFNLVLMTIFWI